MPESDCCQCETSGAPNEKKYGKRFGMQFSALSHRFMVFLVKIFVPANTI